MTVSPLQGVTHACFGLSYLCAFLLELARLVWPRAGLRAAALTFGVAGLLAHTVFLARVLAASGTDAAPLTYFRGRLGRLAGAA